MLLLPLLLLAPSVAQLYQVYFFVLGVQYLTELKISLQRIDDFLSMKEPPPPVFQRTAAKAAKAAAAAAAAAYTAKGGPGHNGGGIAGSEDVPIGTVQLRGADYDWAQNLEVRVPAGLTLLWLHSRHICTAVAHCGRMPCWHGSSSLGAHADCALPASPAPD